MNLNNLNLKSFRLMSDAAEGGQPASAAMDEEDLLLSTDTSKVDTSFPILPECVMDMEIVSVEKVANKAGTGKNLVVKMKTTVEKIPYGNQGDPIQAGFPVTTYIAITPTETYTKTMVEKAIASFTKSIDANATSILPLDQWAGKMAQVKVSYRKEKDGYPAQNGFRFFPLKPAK